MESSIENTMAFFKASDLSNINAKGNEFDDLRNKVMKNEAKLNRDNCKDSKKKKRTTRNTGATKKSTGGASR